MPLIDYISGPLETNAHYHIYNRANGFGRLFFHTKNYVYFLNKWEQYTRGMLTTYAHCLLPNHFHFLVRTFDAEKILEQDQVKKIHPGRAFAEHLVKDRMIELANLNRITRKDLKVLIERDDLVRRAYASWLLTENLRRLFLGYAKAINKQQGRYGSLLQTPFRRKLIPEEDLKRVIVYIHRNPVHHGFAETMEEYPWSSYPALAHGGKQRQQTPEVLRLFDGLESFRQVHLHEQNDWWEINMDPLD